MISNLVSWSGAKSRGQRVPDCRQFVNRPTDDGLPRPHRPARAQGAVRAKRMTRTPRVSVGVDRRLDADDGPRAPLRVGGSRPARSHDDRDTEKETTASCGRNRGGLQGSHRSTSLVSLFTPEAPLGTPTAAEHLELAELRTPGAHGMTAQQNGSGARPRRTARYTVGLLAKPVSHHENVR